MALQNFPAALIPAIQQNYLEREYMEAIHSVLTYRMVAAREKIGTNIGETLTKTRRGLKAPVTTPVAPAANTNLDNGMPNSGTFAIEQYTITLNQYQDYIDLNMVTNKVGIVSQFLQNAYVNAVQAAQSLDRLARGALFSAYFGGNTRVRTTLGGAGIAVNVDDVRGFFTVPANGVMVAVSASNTLSVTVGSNVYTLVGAVADGTQTAALAVAGIGAAPPLLTFSGTGANVSTAPGGFSGVLTFSGNVTVADGTLNNTVQAANASAIIRPSGRANTSLLQATDTLTMQALLDGVATLRLNNVPGVAGGLNGATGDSVYNCYLDPKSARQLFADPDFKQLFQGATSASQVFQRGMTNDFLGLRFMPTTEAYTQVIAGIGTVRRPIIVGGEALIEGDYAATGTSDVEETNNVINMVDDIAFVTRAPIDRQGQIISQAWNWTGGFTAPSDITTNTQIIPTATNAAFKRAVMLEHVG
jgi:hypothetical protein